MRTAVCIVAHAGDQDLYNRHRHLWRPHNGDICVIHPWGRQLKTAFTTHTYMSEDGGKSHIRRWRSILRLLARMEADRFVLFEPDSFCLSPEIPQFYAIGPDRIKRYDVPMVVGNVKYAPSPHALVPTAHLVLHPVILSHSAVRLLLERWEGIPDDFEGGHSDRALFRLAQDSGIRIADFHRYGLGYGQIRVFPSEYQAMAQAVTKGATFLHGIKEPEALQVVVRALDKRDKKGDIIADKTLPIVDDMTACWIPGQFYGYLLKDLDADFWKWFSSRATIHSAYPELAVWLRQL